MPWRCGLPDDFSDLAAAAEDPEDFPAPLDAPVVVPPFEVGAAAAAATVAPPASDRPGPPATESPCPTVAMALSLSLGRVLVEPME